MPSLGWSEGGEFSGAQIYEVFELILQLSPDAPLMIQRKTGETAIRKSAPLPLYCTKTQDSPTFHRSFLHTMQKQ